MAVIDTQVNAPMAARLIQQAQALADKPLRYAINTHYHWDHTAGNYVCKRAGATVVSSVLASVHRDTWRQATGLRRVDLMGLPFNEWSWRVDQPGDRPSVSLAPGLAETDDALVIHLPQEGCVIAGDTVMTGSFPMFGQPVMNEGLMGTIDWLETLACIERLQPVHVLPGHGPVAHDRELALLKRLERYFLDEVASRVRRGMPLPVLLADLESQLPEWITAIPVVWGTPRYAILRVYRGLIDDPAGEAGWQPQTFSHTDGGPGAGAGSLCYADRLTGLAGNCQGV